MNGLFEHIDDEYKESFFIKEDWWRLVARHYNTSFTIIPDIGILWTVHIIKSATTIDKKDNSMYCIVSSNVEECWKMFQN